MAEENRSPPRNALRKYPALVLLILVSAAALLIASGNDVSLTSPGNGERARVQFPIEPVRTPQPTPS